MSISYITGALPSFLTFLFSLSKSKGTVLSSIYFFALYLKSLYLTNIKPHPFLQGLLFLFSFILTAPPYELTTHTHSSLSLTITHKYIKHTYALNSEYGSPAWSPHLRKHTDLLMKFQQVGKKRGGTQLHGKDRNHVRILKDKGKRPYKIKFLQSN